jgi:hypothetical protein
VAVACTAEAVYEGLDVSQGDVACQLFLRLVYLGGRIATHAAALI